MSVWQTLSAVDVRNHIEDKGGFSYIKWTSAWKEVKDRYPDANYEMLSDTTYPDGTMEVRCAVTIDGMRHVMWLPVTNHSNRAIVSPNAFDINTARMRCLTKAIAMHGLGAYVYAGESVPQAPAASQEDFDKLVSILAKGEPVMVRKFADEVGPEVMTEIFNMAPAGNKSKFKEQVREAYREANKMINAYCEQIREATEANDEIALSELAEEINEAEYGYAARQMGDVDFLRFKEVYATVQGAKQ